MASASTDMDVDPMIATKERDEEINKIMKIVNIIIQELGDQTRLDLEREFKEHIINIDVSNEISGVLMFVIKCLRKEEHDEAGHDRYKSYIANISGIQISVQAIVEKVKSAQIQLNLLVATPIAELMTLFKPFFNEVRTGVTRFRVTASVAKRGLKRDMTGKTKLNDEDMIRSISQYGLVHNHIPLLQGVTLHPKRRTGVIRSLGPMTQAILLVLEDKCHTELANSLMNSIQMLPMRKEIINFLKDSPSPGLVQGILKELADILLMTTARSTQMIYFPLLLTFNMWFNKPNDLNWSFSGSSMLKEYNRWVEDGLKFKMKSGADPLKTAEVIFHSIFGTYLEDLSILSQITTHVKWSQRQDLNSVFINRASKKDIIITPIKFKYVLKMAHSLFTKSLGNVDDFRGQTTSRPSFSGFRKRTFTQEFLNYLQPGKTSFQSISSDPLHLLSSLRKAKDSLIKEKDSVKLLFDGTKEWEEFKNGHWVASQFVPVAGNTNFFFP